MANREGQTVADRGAGVSPGRPHLGRPGGINRQLPNLGNAGQGVNRQLPNLGNAGQGVNRQLPNLGDAGRGSHARDFDAGGAGQARNEWDKSLCLDGEAPIRGYLRALAARIRRVRVCCGDWSRIVTDGALSYGSTVGVFLDPPYLGTERTKGCYAVDDYTISNEVREWALAHGDDKRLRIVLAGYVPEHEEHMPATWRRHAYSAGASYQTAAGARGEGNGQNRENRHKECLWFSPGCLKPARTLDLFG